MVVSKGCAVAISTLDNLSRPAFGAKRFQPLFSYLLRVSLRGMNIGASADLVRDSGERGGLARLPASPVVIDVGANVGDYASMVLEERPEARVWCFEPSGTAYLRLQDRLGDRVVTRNIGLGASKGELDLYGPEAGSPLTSLHERRHDSVAFSATERARIDTLDQVAEDEHIGRIDLLKLDVKGSELDVLRGSARLLSMGLIDAIQFEFGGANIDSRTFVRDFHELLSPAYTIYRVVRDGHVPVAYSELLEIFSTTNYLAVRKPAAPGSAPGARG